MGAINSNYVAGITGFTAFSYFEAPNNIGSFNAAGDFSAFVAFWLDPSFIALGVADPSEQFLIGNKDDANDTGWALRILPGGNGLPGSSADPILVAEVGNGAATVQSALAFTDSNNLTPQPGVSYINRLILAGLWYDSALEQIWLTVNGNPMPVGDVGAPYAPSALALRVGRSPNGTGSESSNQSIIFGCGYSAPPFFPTQNNFFRLAGTHFQSAREGLFSGAVEAYSSLDWIHRWDAGQAGVGRQGTLGTAATGGGPFVTSFPPAPATWTDVGGQMARNLSTAGQSEDPIDLTAVTVPGVQTVQTLKNPDWYHGAAYAFLGSA